MLYSETLEFNAHQLKIESNAGKDVTYGWLVTVGSLNSIRFGFGAH